MLVQVLVLHEDFMSYAQQDCRSFPLPFWHSPWTSTPSQNSAMSWGKKNNLAFGATLASANASCAQLSQCLDHT